MPEDWYGGLEKYKTNAREFLSQIPKLNDAVSDNKIEKWFSDIVIDRVKKSKGLNGVGSFVHDQAVNEAIEYRKRQVDNSNENRNLAQDDEVRYKKISPEVSSEDNSPGREQFGEQERDVRPDRTTGNIPKPGTIKRQAYDYVKRLVDNHRIKEFDAEYFDNRFNELNRKFPNRSITGIADLIYEGLPDVDMADGGVRFKKAEKLPATIKVNGKERTTTNSEGNPIHPTIEGIKNFWNWFGDSKVVDSQGRPQVVYHETTEEGEKGVLEGGFKHGLERAAKYDFETPYGFFFKTNDNKIGIGEKQIPVYLKIENPFYVSDRQSMRQIANIENGEYANITKEIERVDKEYGQMFDALEKESFDVYSEWYKDKSNSELANQRKAIDEKNDN